MSSLKQSLHFGLEFVAFLGDRMNGINKDELRWIYNNDFKERDGIKRPGFSKIYYALREYNKICIVNGDVYLSSRAVVHFYSNQWRRPRVRQPNPGRCERQTAILALNARDPKRLCAEILQRMRVNRKEMLADKGGVIITSNPMAISGKVQVSKKPLVVSFHIVNRSPNCINFTFYHAISRIRCFSLEDERRVSRVNPVFLYSEESYDVVVRCKLDEYGYFPATVFFEFQPDVPEATPFYIVREIEVSVEPSLESVPGPVAPYKPFKKAARTPVARVVVDGVPPVYSGSQRMPAKVKLGEYTYPRYLKKLVKHKMEDSEVLSSDDKRRLASVKNLLDSSLDMENYSKRFHLLLHLEELQMEVDIRKYDLHGQTMTLDKRNSKFLILEVPGLAENRPSVLRGDCVTVSRSEDAGSEITVYKGYVHKIELNKLMLGFCDEFVANFISNMKFDVEFTLNRLTLKLQHRAVDMATKANPLLDVLFPSAAAKSSCSLPELSMFNRGLEDNPEQCKAVQHIVAGSSQPAPYVVFGPPGTGKTVTLVEAIKQILKLNSSAHILACAPSNSACDVLCERLLDSFCSYQVYRMNAQSRDPASVPETLRKNCNLDEKLGCFYFRDTEFLMKFRVIVTTLYTAGRLVTGGVPVNHFSHVFVDEAGQALEPETVIAIAGLLSPQEGQLVLAGDPKQLGPIVQSPIALKHQFGLSLLERLMEFNDLYKTSDPRFVTKLQKNYRWGRSVLKPVEKIRLALKKDRLLSQKLNLTGLKVGSVEEFQGQEKKIIMISTVRSSTNYVKMDQDFNIGFLSNEKRFNVAITRAKSLLIVVGNPLILRTNPVWEKFINYCLDKKGYTGFPLEKTDNEDAFVLMMAALRIMDTEC
ncbi:putative helicase mov-10-B.2 [Oryzias melastigma]|uniref:RNA helicase n=1 Tax=Oryzias melastigma TaxID=30732 RepID=A0A834FGR1_ORYME|nr:putative helicase mov-10-B.2 [Oryzias melastigma]